LKNNKKEFKISYSYVAVDIFHYGHFRLLEAGKKCADFHICGLLTDNICEEWNGNIVMNYKERVEILKSLNCVDKVMKQDSIDPTQNLKSIHKKYPDAKIILFEGHQEWKNMPGANYVRSINGKIVKPPFYSRLTRNYIKDELSKSIKNTKYDLESYLLGNISYFSVNNATKADILESLVPLLNLSKIEELFIFDTSGWVSLPDKILKTIKSKFPENIVIRSSSSLEDNLKFSNAGVFHTELAINSQSDKSIKTAINKVIKSYKKNGNSDINQQILVQNHTKNVKISGVIFTRDILKNSPYYVINYDFGNKTDTVTSGLVNNNIRIIKNTTSDNLPNPWNLLIKAVKEIENLLLGLALDIEFAITKNNEVVIFQVRPLAAVNRFIDIPDKKIYNVIKDCKQRYEDLYNETVLEDSYTLSDMSFWNPAEIIGSRPDNLSYSLYQYIILNKEWNSGLVPLGYKKTSKPIMVRILNKPYIELERAFKSLMPYNIDIKTEKALIRFYIDKLRNNPDLHDKIEFEISHNCFLPTSNNDLKNLKNIFNKDQFDNFRLSLIKLTKTIFNNFERFKKQDLDSLSKLNRKRTKNEKYFPDCTLQRKIILIIELLDDIKEFGTPQFARMARLAFIGNQYLKSLVEIGVITKGEVNLFLSSINTIASDLKSDFNSVINKKLGQKEFNKKYGHLRPGTYNINNLPYRKEPKYFNKKRKVEKIDKENFSSNKLKALQKLKDKIENYLKDFEINISADFLMRFIEDTTKYRELFKFDYTKNLSLAIEWLAEIGDELGLSRKELSYLTIENLKGISASTQKSEIYESWSSSIKGQSLKDRIYDYITLPSIIFEKTNLECVILHSTTPNFITNKKVESEIINLELLKPDEYDKINDKIVLLEQADPGFDWIFSKKINGLVTRYGGVASHMAIRCAEFELPAAIGCGEYIYDKLKESQFINLDCNNKLISNL